MARAPAFHVYVIELTLPSRKPGVYVGQTHLDPQVRLEHHLRGGPPASRWVRHYGTRVAAVAGPYATRNAAERAETQTAAKYRRAGYAVKGGH